MVVLSQDEPQLDVAGRGPKIGDLGIGDTEDLLDDRDACALGMLAKDLDLGQRVGLAIALSEDWREAIRVQTVAGEKLPLRL